MLGDSRSRVHKGLRGFSEGEKIILTTYFFESFCLIAGIEDSMRRLVRVTDLLINEIPRSYIVQVNTENENK